MFQQAFFLAFDFDVPLVAAAHVGSLCSPLNVLSGAVSVNLNLSAFLDQVNYHHHHASLLKSSIQQVACFGA